MAARAVSASLRSDAARAASGSYTNLVSIPGAVCGSGRGEKAGACVSPAPEARRSAGNMGLGLGVNRELLPLPSLAPALLPPPLLPHTLGLAAGPRTPHLICVTSCCCCSNCALLSPTAHCLACEPAGATEVHCFV